MSSRLQIISNGAPKKAKSLSVVGDGGQCGSGGCSTDAETPERPLTQSQYRGKAAVVTLGCAKNRVDSEVMLGVLHQRGFEIVNDVDEADLAVVNTCGFLQAAIDESIDCILDLGSKKTTGRLRKLLVAGCLVERFRSDPEWSKALPEVDALLTTDDLLKVADVALGEEHIFDDASRPYFLYDDAMPRTLSTPQHTAYLKIAEGCNRPCTFCIIPKIRGSFRSRPVESIVREAADLAARGVREANLVAQDLTSYGIDLKSLPGSGNPDLADLLRALDAESGLSWIRLLYLYPVGVTRKFLDAVVELPSVCDYLDIPLQHVAEPVLKTMKRPLGSLSPRKLVEFIRREYPSIKLRTTFIVGFPGETDEQARELAKFVAEGHFASVGVFTYSQEGGTPAGEMSDQVTARAKKARQRWVLEAQQRVVEASTRALVGQNLEVLVEGPHPETPLLLAGRTRFQAPEVDGNVIINDIEGDPALVTAGSIIQCEVTEVSGYDLIARAIVGDAGQEAQQHRGAGTKGQSSYVGGDANGAVSV